MSLDINLTPYILGPGWLNADPGFQVRGGALKKIAPSVCAPGAPPSGSAPAMS
jgi:hypothetical protein